MHLFYVTCEDLVEADPVEEFVSSGTITFTFADHHWFVWRNKVVAAGSRSMGGRSIGIREWIRQIYLSIQYFILFDLKLGLYIFYYSMYSFCERLFQVNYTA